MFRSMANKVAWVGRTASMVFGLALVLALVLGVVTMAAAAVPGDPFRLGQTNSIDKISTLVGSASSALLKIENEGDGPALDLRVDSGQAPMKVNSTRRVNALNADQVDGKNAAQLEGVNGLEVAYDTSEINSSPYKVAVARCSNANGIDFKAVVGTGYEIQGDPYRSGHVVVTQVETIKSQNAPYAFDVVVTAVEAQPVRADWSVRAEAICATMGTP